MPISIQSHAYSFEAGVTLINAGTMNGDYRNEDTITINSMIAISNEEYVSVLCKYASEHFDRKIDAFAFKYRCGSYGTITLKPGERVLVREDIVKFIGRVGGVKKIDLGISRDHFPLKVYVDKVYEGTVFMQEIHSDIERLLKQVLPSGTKYTLELFIS